MNTIFAFRVDEELTVKMADFGLSCDVYRTNYYRMEDKHRPLPVQWMAIECLTLGVFTSKSDVVSNDNLHIQFEEGCSFTSSLSSLRWTIL